MKSKNKVIPKTTKLKWNPTLAVWDIFALSVGFNTESRKSAYWVVRLRWGSPFSVPPMATGDARTLEGARLKAEDYLRQHCKVTLLKLEGKI